MKVVKIQSVQKQKQAVNCKVQDRHQPCVRVQDGVCCCGRGYNVMRLEVSELNVLEQMPFIVIDCFN